MSYYIEGIEAWNCDVHTNPYRVGTFSYSQWEYGYLDAVQQVINNRA